MYPNMSSASSKSEEKVRADDRAGIFLDLHESKTWVYILLLMILIILLKYNHAIPRIGKGR